MKMFFVNSSKQYKKLIESDYIEDLYDVIEDFFDEHKHRPHLLRFVSEGSECKISFESGCEGFEIEDVSASDVTELKKLLDGES